MTKYYDRSGIEISSAKIRCVDSVKGTAEYTFRIVCDKCNGRGERKHFYRSRCMACKATGYSLETTRTAYTLNALYRINAQAARKVSASLQDERLRTESAKVLRSQHGAGLIKKWLMQSPNNPVVIIFWKALSLL